MGGWGQIPSPGHHSWETLYFDPNGTWPAFMDHVKVVSILTQVFVKMSDAELAKVAARLKEKHIALGIEMLPQADDDPPGCGAGVESYYATFMVANIAAKLKRTGAEPIYISMDEPLYFGHYFDGKNACHSSIDNVADRVAKNMKEYLKVFPNVIIGDGEPVPSITDVPHWKEEYKQWMEAFHAKVGKEIAFTNLDINWGVKNWPESVKDFARFARDLKLPVGIIYNDAPPPAAMTVQAWLDECLKNADYIEGKLGIVPEWAVFASWVRYPGHVLTEGGEPGQDYLVKQYLAKHH
jgi:hypothetical protein